MLKRIGVFVIFVVFAVLFVFCIATAGLGKLYWFNQTPMQLSIPIRIGFLVGALLLYALHIRYWAKSHDSAFLRDKIKALPEGIFYPLSDADAKKDFELAYQDIYDRFNLGDLDQTDGLTKQLVKRSFRRRIHERVEIASQEICHDITFHLRTKNWGELQEGGLLVAVTRLKKQSPYEQLSICGQDGVPVEVVNYRHALGLLYGLIRTQIQAYKVSNPRLDECNILTELAALIAAPAVDAKQEKRRIKIYQDVTGNPDRPTAASPGSNILLWSFLAIALERRPVIAIIPKSSAADSVITVRYRERLMEYDLPADLPSGWWERWIRRFRMRIGLRPAELFLAATRARSASTYKMTFTAPPGAYIEEARAYSYDQNRWLPNLNRHAYYNAFVGWTDPRGRGQSSMACRLLKKTTIKDLQFYVRLTERPPGRAASALVVALAATLVVWIAGFMAPLPLKPNNNVDVVALAAAFPGVLAVWLSVSAPAQLGAFRSVTAFMSTLVSGLVSVSAIVMYIQDTSKKLNGAPMGNESAFFSVHSIHWTILLIISIVNLVVVAGSFSIAVRRYRNRIAPQERNPNWRM